MPKRDQVFTVQHEYDDRLAIRWYTLAGERHGPFLSPAMVEFDLVSRIEAWRQQALRVGGTVWRRSATELVLSTPDYATVE